MGKLRHREWTGPAPDHLECQCETQGLECLPRPTLVPARPEGQSSVGEPRLSPQMQGSGPGRSLGSMDTGLGSQLGQGLGTLPHTSCFSLPEHLRVRDTCCFSPPPSQPPACRHFSILHALQETELLLKTRAKLAGSPRLSRVFILFVKGFKPFFLFFNLLLLAAFEEEGGGSLFCILPPQSCLGCSLGGFCLLQTWAWLWGFKGSSDRAITSVRADQSPGNCG